MKLIIAGSRTLQASILEIDALLAHYKIRPTEIVSGTAKGIDRSGEAYAKHLKIPLKLFPADWDLHGKPAGHIRNKDMAKYADALLLIWDGSSKGSQNMKNRMLDECKLIYEVTVRPIPSGFSQP